MKKVKTVSLVALLASGGNVMGDEPAKVSMSDLNSDNHGKVEKILAQSKESLNVRLLDDESTSKELTDSEIEKVSEFLKRYKDFIKDDRIAKGKDGGFTW